MDYVTTSIPIMIHYFFERESMARIFLKNAVHLQRLD